MNPIELAASDSRLATVNVGEKALLFLGLLFLAIALPPISLLPIAVCVVGLAVWARVPARLYLTLVMAPAAFLAVGIWPLVYAITADGVHYLGWQHGAYVLARSVVGMAATMLFALTTPMAEILGALRFLPASLVQLIALIYRFVGTLMVTAKAMWEAQQARLGYSTFRRAIVSAAQQAASLFVLTFLRARALEEGLELRGDPYRLDTATVSRPVRWHVVAGTVALFALIIWSSS